MAITLGFAPYAVSVALCRGSGFDTTIRTTTGDFPDGAGAELRFYVGNAASPVTTWAATVDGAEMSWDETAGSVTAVVAAGALTVRLYYLGGADPVLWAVGGAHVY